MNNPITERQRELYNQKMQNLFDIFIELLSSGEAHRAAEVSLEISHAQAEWQELSGEGPIVSLVRDVS